MAKTLVYQIYLFGFLEKEVISKYNRFCDKGAIQTATQHLPLVQNLGADVVWLGPIFKSPWCDHGYDIANHYWVEPNFGSIEEFDAFVKKAHQLGLKVIIDLVLNHTSTTHKWFHGQPDYYYWSDQDRPSWKNLFNGGSAWYYDEKSGEYYLHLFHHTQADLNWFPHGPQGGVNSDLVKEFQQIIDYWVQEHNVDGFRLDVPQSINKDLSADEFQFEDALFGDQAIEVINAVFQGRENLFLIMECFDPTMGELVKRYVDSTPVDFVMNVLLKDEVNHGSKKFLESLNQQAQIPGFMLELESHDAPRFLSRGITPEEEIWWMFNSEVEGVCLYQGQELGLTNPSKKELSDNILLALDVQTAMRFIMGEDLDDLRPVSRANARIKLPLKAYEFQLQNPSSYFNLTKRWIERWRNPDQKEHW